MNYFEVLLVGAGSIGSRYLQGLSRVSLPLSIITVDPSSSSLDVARSRLAEEHELGIHQYEFRTGLECIPEKIDLAIIATPADCRLSIVEDVADRSSVTSWLLEKVLAQSLAQIDKIECTLDSSSCMAWVNTPRRLMPWHNSLKAELFGESSTFEAEVVGGQWGLACNAIHFIDLFSWWSSSKIKSIDCGGIDCWEESKRSGFIEAYGRIRVVFSNGSNLDLCAKKGDAPPIIKISLGSTSWVLNETTGSARNNLGKFCHGNLLRQSDLTKSVVEGILLHGSCGLPGLKESALHHRMMLKAMLHNWNLSNESNQFVLPIT